MSQLILCVISVHFFFFILFHKFCAIQTSIFSNENALLFFIVNYLVNNFFENFYMSNFKFKREFSYLLKIVY